MSNAILPVDLIVANALHDTASSIERFESNPAVARLLQRAVMRRKLAEDWLRQLLCDISHQADLSRVMQALAACGAPSTADEMEQRLQAVQDQRRGETPAASASPGPVAQPGSAGETSQ